MTNKDYSYLNDILATCICFVYDNTVHKGLITERRINRIKDKLCELLPDEREYLRQAIKDYFEEMRRMRKENEAKSQRRK